MAGDGPWAGGPARTGGRVPRRRPGDHTVHCGPSVLRAAVGIPGNRILRLRYDGDDVPRLPEPRPSRAVVRRSRRRCRAPLGRLVSAAPPPDGPPAARTAWPAGAVLRLR